MIDKAIYEKEEILETRVMESRLNEVDLFKATRANTPKIRNTCSNASRNSQRDK